jgi:hypothetical protein
LGEPANVFAFATDRRNVGVVTSTATSARRFEVGLSGKSSVNRRLVVGAGVAAAAGLAWPLQTQAIGIIQRGIGGGGLAQFELSDAQFSFFASRLIFDETTTLIVGGVSWVDATSGFTFATTELTAYEVLEVPPEQGEARRLIGTMSVNGAEEYPFSLDVFDVGLPGSGTDSVVLTVGDGALLGLGEEAASGHGFSYGAAGPVVVGDIQDIVFEVDTEQAVELAATPTA